MRLLKAVTSVGRSVVVLAVVGAMFASACAGKSEQGDEDGDNGGSPSVGGTNGTAGVLGGSGSGQPSCVPVCERINACTPEASPLDCSAECRDIEDEAVVTGCSAQLRNYLTCLSQVSDVCSESTIECEATASAYASCLEGGGSAGCTSGAGTNASCTALCERAQACPDATTTDCATGCDEQLASAAEAGCSGQYQALLACASTCTNICAFSETDCPLEFDAYVVCLGL